MATSIVVAAVSAVVAGILDVRAFKVPNLLTVPLAVAGVIFHAIHGGWSGLGASLLGALFGFGVLLALYVLGLIGAGDVKLMAALGAWLGISDACGALAVAAVAGAVYSGILLAWQGGWPRVAASYQVLMFQLGTIGKHMAGEDRWEASADPRARRRRMVPFAAMLAVGVIAVAAWRLLTGSGVNV